MTDTSNSYYNPSDPAWDKYFAPDKSWLDWQQGNLAGQSAFIGAEQKYNDKLATQSYQDSLARLGLSEQGLGIDRNALNRQQGYLGQEYGLKQQTRGLDLQQLGALHGIAGQEFGLQQQGIQGQEQTAGQMHQLAGQDIGIQKAGVVAQQNLLSQQFPIQMRQMGGQAAAQGSTVTLGNRENIQLGNAQNQFATTSLDRAMQELGIAGQREDVGYNQSMQDFQIAMQMLGLGQQREGIGYQGDVARQGIGAQEDALGYQQSQGDINDSMQRLGLQDQGYGLDRTKLGQDYTNTQQGNALSAWNAYQNTYPQYNTYGQDVQKYGDSYYGARTQQ